MNNIIDRTLAFVGLLLLSPLFIVIAILIKLDSPGSVIFRQTRLGKNTNHFSIIKFRTMVDRKHIDQTAEPIIEGKTDRRITRIGKLLRSSSIDELPQLINVLKGEMCLVGPRPILPEQLQVVPNSLLSRFSVNPGITGLAQVNGRRNLDWMQQLEYDKAYVESRSFSGDVRILFRTLHVVISGSGIYGEAGKNWRAHLNPHSDKVASTGVNSHVSNTVDDDYK